MVYTAFTAASFRNKPGTLSEKLAADSSAVKAETDSIWIADGKSAINIVDLTASMVSSTDLASNGVDLASGTNATYAAVWCAPVACTIVGMDTFLTEAYVKETNDAKIEFVDNAASPVTKVSYTLPTAGRAVKSMSNTTGVASPTMAAGDILALKITSTLSTSGTGHAKVFLRYTVN